MKKIIKDFDEFLAGMFLIMLVVLIAANVLFRYFFNFIFNWAEELATVSFVWCVFIAVASAYKTNRHIAIDIIFNMFPKSVQKVLDILVDVLVLILNIGITYLSVILCISSVNKPTPILRVPYSYINASLTVGFGLMVIYGCIHIIKKLKDFRVTKSNPLI